MTSRKDGIGSGARALPDTWRDAILSQMRAGETPLAWMPVDLGPELDFQEGLLLLTGQRLLSCAQSGAEWQSWPLSPGMELRLKDHAGIGTLSLHNAAQRVAVWRHTLRSGNAAQTLAARFEQLQRGPALASSSAEDNDPELSAGTAPQPEPPGTWALLRLWRFARPYRLPLLAGFVLTLVSTAASLVAPYLTMPLMDRVLIPFQNGNPLRWDLVHLYLGALLASALLAWCLGWGRTYVLARVSERIGADLRTATYAHLQQLPLQYYGGKRTGDLMARIGTESDRICLFLSLHLLDFATDMLVLLMTAAILFSINPWLALVTLLPLPLIIWLIHLVRDRLRHGFEKVDRVWAELTNVLADTIPGIRVVKAFAQEDREIRRFRAANDRNLAINDRVNRIWALFSPSVTLLTEAGLLVVWAFGIWLVAHDQITVGVLTAFLTYISRFYVRLDSMSRIVSHTQKAAVGAKRIFDILDHVSTVPEPPRPVPIEQVKGRIQLRRVGFRYGNRKVLRDLDLDIAPGELIGLVGHSGSGKSTLINLICRFYDVSQGAILLDGVDIRRHAVADYRRHIGLVLQEPFLFFGTIAENIAYGRPDAGRREIIAAARAAHAHEFILRLPQAYDSLVGERGQALSGGERQRISIARALLIDPPILILDEATASVDTATEKEIQKALDNLVKGRTTLCIAHRLSTLRQADRLVVLEHGDIVETGTHEELLARRGAYHALYLAQAQDAGAVSPAFPMTGAPQPSPRPDAEATPASFPAGYGNHGSLSTAAGLPPLARDAHGQLLLHPPGWPPLIVVPVRAFPLSATEENISLIGPDGGEAGWVERLSDLPPASQALIREELAGRACTPVIERITRISSRATPSHWQVGTDRGPTRLTLKAEEDIRRLPDGALLIADAHGLSFLIPQVSRLDKTSRRLLDHFL